VSNPASESEVTGRDEVTVMAFDDIWLLLRPLIPRPTEPRLAFSDVWFRVALRCSALSPMPESNSGT